MEPSARLFYCLRCHTQVVICRRCDRGQRYCGADCATAARRESSRRAACRYQRTRPGRFANAQRQQRFRDKAHDSTRSLCDPVSRADTKVTHQGSVPLRSALPYRIDQTDTVHLDALSTRHSTVVRCHGCGCVCSAFLRRDYLSTAARSPP